MCIFIQFLEPFVEAIPQLFLNGLTVCVVSVVSTFRMDECGLNPVGKFQSFIFWISFNFSVISSCVGILKFFKKGPTRLLPQTKSYTGQFLLLNSVFFNLLARGFTIYFITGFIHSISFLQAFLVWSVVTLIFEVTLGLVSDTMFVPGMSMVCTRFNS